MFSKKKRTVFKTCISFASRYICSSYFHWSFPCITCWRSEPL